MMSSVSESSDENFKLMPYGISSFQRIIKEDKFFIDKTNFISLLEKNFPFGKIWKPRRFGKSLMCTQLELYYDCNVSNEEVKRVSFTCFFFKLKTKGNT